MNLVAARCRSIKAEHAAHFPVETHVGSDTEKGTVVKRKVDMRTDTQVHVIGTVAVIWSDTQHTETLTTYVFCRFIYTTWNITLQISVA